ncbi:HPP family protein [Sphingopyxis lindanitolerans]|uniref:HPP family protein n=1 Tax=Sphingopyxis lindanitolerans TaxID=2054227 RepID=UPI001304A80F|nr:HPP family protein [Sphingopyxis lindanitolerans]
MNAYDQDTSVLSDESAQVADVESGSAPNGVLVAGDSEERSRRSVPPPITAAIAGGSAMGAVVGLLVAISQAFSSALVITALASSTATVIGTSGTPPTRPSAILYGHISSALCGLAIAAMMAPGPLAYGVAVGLASGVMLVTRRLHPPAAANAIISFIYRDTMIAYLFAVIAIAFSLALLSVILRARVSMQRPVDE